MSTAKQTATKVAGGIFTAAVSTLLIVLYAFKVHVDHFARPIEGPKDVYFCKTAPAAAVRAFEEAAQSFWEEHGVQYRKIIKDDDCGQTCPWTDKDGSVKNVVCHPGAITVDLMSAADAAVGSGSPGDRGYYNKTPDLGDKLGQLQWYTLVFPAKLDPPMVTDENGLSVPADIPVGAYAMVVAHAFGHAEGLDHTYTKVLGSKLVSRKKGELMNPDVQDLGWGDRGLPETNK